MRISFKNIGLREMIRYIPVLALLLLPSHLSAAESAGDLVIVADSRNLTGLAAWWVNIYNESHFYFALLTDLVVPLAAQSWAAIADL